MLFDLTHVGERIESREPLPVSMKQEAACARADAGVIGIRGTLIIPSRAVRWHVYLVYECSKANKVASVELFLLRFFY